MDNFFCRTIKCSSGLTVSVAPKWWLTLDFCEYAPWFFNCTTCQIILPFKIWMTLVFQMWIFGFSGIQYYVDKGQGLWSGMLSWTSRVLPVNNVNQFPSIYSMSMAIILLHVSFASWSLVCCQGKNASCTRRSLGQIQQICTICVKHNYLKLNLLLSSQSNFKDRTIQLRYYW